MTYDITANPDPDIVEIESYTFSLHRNLLLSSANVRDIAAELLAGVHENLADSIQFAKECLEEDEADD